MSQELSDEAKEELRMERGILDLALRHKKLLRKLE